ncbi:DUF4159 domain-containing protein [Anthocerotibacter panamensis]|uniref:DUF4159 domain-containing protein n=1 Tax=Anthocerotibacter panamensis TaxID=2857077 RepID=UPI001C4055CE|nr:DUF4159 domain-containing protein [Anthocerotibacter panamensis]
MSQFYPFPPIQSFERLQAADGLLINAERWDLAHSYHRKRQNFHFQSLHHPGIVSGLGVSVIPTGAAVPNQYRDGRSVQLQPGIALDVSGNPIVVPEPENFQIAVQVGEEPLMVYLVVSYVDPDDLRLPGNRTLVRETFRIDLKTSLPANNEVEVCRILLQPGPVQLSVPADVFFPGYNNLDLRFRSQARARSQAMVRVAQVTHSDPTHTRNFFNLSYLLRAVEALYPALAGAGDVGQVTLDPQEETVGNYDLLYLTGRDSLNLDAGQRRVLAAYLARGGVLLVEAPPDAPALMESTMALAEQFKTPLDYLERLRRNHPLRTQPFLFAALPTLNQQSLRLLTGGGIILVVGDLIAACGLDEALSSSRVAIRTAQELGVNLLHYAWRRQSLVGLQSEDSLESST